MKPSLDNSYARVARADQHLSDLQGVLDTFWESNPQISVSIPAGLTGMFMDAVNAYIPPSISILIGETVYNVRAALDYLIYQLAILDSGKIQKGTQFPIECGPERWDKQKSRIHTHYLKGLCVRHKAAIKRLQPFAGCEWTGTLRELSNADKHRHLLVAYPGIRIALGLRQTETIGSPSQQTMDMQGQHALQVLFDDGSPVIETLQILKEQISSVLDSFYPEFQRK